MSFADLSDPIAVEEAIEEFDRIGRSAFLAKYGFGGSRQYELAHRGRRYDIKAILGAAHGYQFPEEGPLSSPEFGSGARSTVPKLRSLGFQVERRATMAAPVQSSATRAFIFQANPAYYDIEAAVNSLGEMNWSVKQHRRQVRAGDRVYIWKSEPNRGLIAEGTILTDPQPLPTQEGPEFIRDPERFAGEQLRVRLSIDQVLDPPLLAPELMDHPVLGEMRIFKIANNTDYRLSEEEDAALQSLVYPDGRPTLPLEDRVAQWREETSYPRSIDQQRWKERETLVEALSQDNLNAVIDDPSEANWKPLLFEQLAHKAYGDPGNQSTINRLLNQHPEATRRRIAEALAELLYGRTLRSENDVKRLHEVLEDPKMRVPGLSESLTTKALAVTRPRRWLPLYQYSGKMGKLTLMSSPELELDPPTDIEQRPLAKRIELTNDLLKARLDPLIPDDSWGQMVFLYWLREQHGGQDEWDEPEEEPWEPFVEPGFDEIRAALAAAGLRIDERTLLRYHLSLDSRGFVILSGLSGGGKTWLAELYARALGARHLSVSVAPNWISNEDLLGYLNAIHDNRFEPTDLTRFVREAAREWDLAQANAGPPRPFHVTLDEMNLARVEYYFARFLSAMEVREREGEARLELAPGHELRLTPNLRFSGTVNVDETTHGFADKVLDRAQLIELSASREALAAQIGEVPYRDTLLGIWDAVNEIAPFAFRVIAEITAYVERSEGLREGWENPLDEQVLQKVLPKLRGASPAVESSLTELLEICDGNLPLTAAKARVMQERFQRHEFSSYF